jgi:hypothetical protein
VISVQDSAPCSLPVHMIGSPFSLIVHDMTLNSKQTRTQQPKLTLPPHLPPLSGVRSVCVASSGSAARCASAASRRAAAAGWPSCACPL